MTSDSKTSEIVAPTTEAVARAICNAEGVGPVDEMWRDFIEPARAAIEAVFPPIVAAVIDAAEQACRYALKHQNFGVAAREDNPEYVEGFEIGCQVCEGAIRRHVEGKLVGNPVSEIDSMVAFDPDVHAAAQRLSKEIGNAQ